MDFIPLLHYEVVPVFRKEFYKHLLTFEHLQNNGNQVLINKMYFPDGGKDEDANFWGYIFEKDGTRYLLPSEDEHGKELNLRQLLPIVAQDTQKVATGGNPGTVYRLIQRPVSARFQSLRTMTFKKLIDSLCLYKHSNPEHQKLYAMMSISQMMSRANYRIATPPGFGKDSMIVVCGSLFGAAYTIESPTIAKLEYLADKIKWLAINEVMDIAKDDWRNIEQFLLLAGAHKPEVTKHSRGGGKYGGKEILDISDLSLSLLYNDVSNYPEPSGYLDLVAKEAVLDRFPPFRLYGRFTEDFTQIRNFDVKGYVHSHMADYKDMIYAFTYYKDNLFRELHGWNINKLVRMTERWTLNVSVLLKIIDLYCDSQEEFDHWIDILNASHNDYKEMLGYMDLLDKFEKKNTAKALSDMKQQLAQVNTYKERNRLLGAASGTNYHNDKGFWSEPT